MSYGFLWTCRRTEASLLASRFRLSPHGGRLLEVKRRAGERNTATAAQVRAGHRLPALSGISYKFHDIAKERIARSLEAK